MVPGLEEDARLPVLDEGGDASHGGGYGGLVHPGPLGQGVGEALGEGGEQGDVDGVEEGVYVFDPAREAHPICKAQLPGQLHQIFLFLPVPGDGQLQVGLLIAGQPHGPQQGGDVFYRGEPGHNARYHVSRLHGKANGPEELLPGNALDGGGEVDAVSDILDAVGREVSLDKQVGNVV